jgi:hypothetical protein
MNGFLFYIKKIMTGSTGFTGYLFSRLPEESGKSNRLGGAKISE